MRSLIIPFALIALAACNNPGETTSGDSADSAVVPTDSLAQAGKPTVGGADTTVGGCYSYTLNRDTVTFQLDANGTTLSGPLAFNYFEKDRNTGTFTGELVGDTVSGFYLFKSEGTMSVRQEIFRKVGSELLPATGERIERHDSMLFRNPSAVTFDQKYALKKVPCML